MIDDWAGSGLASLTGHAAGAPDLSRAPVLARAREVVARFVDTVTDHRAAAGQYEALRDVDAAQLLSGRAALTRHRRRGRISPGGGTRLLRARDRWVALTLSRTDDIDLLPALFSSPELCGDHWAAVTSRVAQWPGDEFVERARLLGLPASILGETEPTAPDVRSRGITVSPRRCEDLLVADLSPLWAGPLCGQLLTRAGATVVKVESPSRPDGARRGNPDFFDWMNGGKLSYAVDFAADTEAVADLLRVADVVIEGSRPHALDRRGIGADTLPPRPGQVWLRISAHGAQPPGAQWPGFGDDTAVAGGLVAYTADGPVFCGDAIADPLTGIESARLVADSLAAGGGQVIDVALAHTAATYAALGTVGNSNASASTAAKPTRPSLLGSRGPALGAHNADVTALIRRRK